MAVTTKEAGPYEWSCRLQGHLMDFLERPSEISKGRLLEVMQEFQAAVLRGLNMPVFPVPSMEDARSFLDHRKRLINVELAMFMKSPSALRFHAVEQRLSEFLNWL